MYSMYVCLCVWWSMANTNSLVLLDTVASGCLVPLAHCTLQSLKYWKYWAFCEFQWQLPKTQHSSVPSQCTVCNVWEKEQLWKPWKDCLIPKGVGMTISDSPQQVLHCRCTCQSDTHVHKYSINNASELGTPLCTGQPAESQCTIQTPSTVPFWLRSDDSS